MREQTIVKYLSPATSTAIIRCPRSSYRLVWSALTYISSLPAPKGSGNPSEKRAPGTDSSTTYKEQRECVFRVTRVSGTMKKVEQEAIRRARNEIVRLKREGEEGGMDALENIFGRASSENNLGQDPERGIESEGDDDQDSDSE